MSAAAGPGRYRASRPGRARRRLRASHLPPPRRETASRSTRPAAPRASPPGRLPGRGPTRSRRDPQPPDKPIAARPRPGPIRHPWQASSPSRSCWPTSVARQHPDWPTGIAPRLGVVAGACTGARFRSRLAGSWLPARRAASRHRDEPHPPGHPERTPAGPAALSSPAETPRAPCWHSHRNCPRSGQRRPNTAGIKPTPIVRDMSARVPPDDPAA
jgi:hypothetical protein